MAHHYERTKEKLARTEARLLKTTEERKRLEAELKELRVQEERERLISRGEMLEKHLRDPLALSNDQINRLLEDVFGMADVQRRLDEMLGTVTDDESEVKAVPAADPVPAFSAEDQLNFL